MSAVCPRQAVAGGVTEQDLPGAWHMLEGWNMNPT